MLMPSNANFKQWKCCNAKAKQCLCYAILMLGEANTKQLKCQSIQILHNANAMQC